MFAGYMGVAILQERLQISGLRMLILYRDEQRNVQTYSIASLGTAVDMETPSPALV